MSDEPHNTAPEIWNLGFEEGQLSYLEYQTVQKTLTTYS